MVEEGLQSGELLQVSLLTVEGGVQSRELLQVCLLTVVEGVLQEGGRCGCGCGCGCGLVGHMYCTMYATQGRPWCVWALQIP